MNQLSTLPGRAWLYLTAGVIALMAAAFLSGCSNAEAQLPADQLSWVNPTQRTDGTAFTTQADTLIMWGTVSGGPYATGSQVATFPATTASVPRTLTGVVCYVVIARDTPVTDPTTKAVTQAVSASSAEACKTVLALPKAPTGLAAK